MLTTAGLICFATLMKVRDRSCGEGKGGCACCARALDRNSKPSPEPTARANAKTRIRVLLSFLMMLLTLISISVQTSLTYHESQEYSDKKRVTSLFGSVTRLYFRINHYFLHFYVSEHFNAPVARLFHYLVGDQLPLPTRRL